MNYHDFRKAVPLWRQGPRTISVLRMRCFSDPDTPYTEVEQAKVTIKPSEVVKAWIDAFNQTDAEALASFYSEDAVDHQVAEAPVAGRTAIRDMSVRESWQAEMVCIVENILEDGDWAVLEWRNPFGLRGCGFFHVVNSKIIFQRGYWDKLAFLRMHGLPIPQT